MSPELNYILDPGRWMVIEAGTLEPRDVGLGVLLYDAHRGGGVLPGADSEAVESPPKGRTAYAARSLDVN